MSYTLPDTDRLTITEARESDRISTFVIEPLSPGYGMTVGHSLRRVLLTSLEGAAISAVSIEGVDHEFTTVKGMHEDVVELILNLKAMRVRSEATEPVTLKLSTKGPRVVTAADFAPTADVSVADPDHHLATLGKDGKLVMEVTIEKGRGYVPVERKARETAPIGTIAVDSVFSPIKRVHYEVEHTRVGGKTDFDKLTLELVTDGTVTPAEAMNHAATILVEHFSLVGQAAQAAISQATSAVKKPAKTKKASTKKTTPKTVTK
ncbi:DNA-directed RNA polymerase subunit alpha [Candidatus Berkelbacteria bacterium]|nr:DNA-directed RNA polymerase subunit alpha [Candidatus Berkelbacteria bacterium]